jgi:hypothetical protein
LHINVNTSKSLLEKVAKELDVFISIKKNYPNKLTNVLHANTKYIVLEFANKQVLLPYSPRLYKLCQDLINHDYQEVKKLCQADGCFESMEKIENFNKEFLYKNYKNLNVEMLIDKRIFDIFQSSLSFRDDYVAYRTVGRVDGRDSDFVLVGNIYTNYHILIQSLSKKEEL